MMQLFTIGLNQFNPDGTPQLDGSGNPIPTYGLNDVVGMAKIFTGFSWNMNGNISDQAWSGYGATYAGPGYRPGPAASRPLPSHHSTDEKDFLGVTVPAGSSDPTGDLKIALDTLFNHPNTPIFRFQAADPASGHQQPQPGILAAGGSGISGQRPGSSR